MTESAYISVSVSGLIPTPGGAGVLLTSGEKSIVIFIDQSVAGAIAQIMSGEKAPRPLTHDLMGTAFESFGIELRKVVITHYEDEIFYARLHLKQSNEIGECLTELDARPSDCIALALRKNVPLYIARDVWDAAEDMSWVKQQAT